MKYIAFILFFSCSALFSQVAPPDLRCLSVAQNGNVTLTWIPPADPSNSFFSYEIYCSANSINGPYTNVGTVTNLATNSSVHTTTASLVQTIFYYIITKSSGGSQSSPPSDTLQTIHLNVLSPSGAVALKIDYNKIHAPGPGLNSSSPTFTVNKEYPAGTWGFLGVTREPEYADTISVCNASISYQISLKDNSGCTSLSNIIHGTYTDMYRPGGPNGPLIDSISVLPDGRTTVAWRVPRDLDIVKYQIYFRSASTPTVPPIDLVYGRLSTSYTYTAPDANSQPISLFVAAIDSCSDAAGIYNPSPVTMYLKAKYDQCLYKTQLTWNKYLDMPEGILEYRIYYSSGGNFTQVGSVQDTSFVHDGTAPGKNICYYVRVFNKSKTISASSNRACFFSTQVNTSAFVYIKTASVSGKNSVVLKMLLDTSATSQGIDILRSTDGNNFSNIGFAPFIMQPEIVFTDEHANTGSQSYIYKAIVKDACGNPRAASNVAKTILLKVTEDNQNVFSKHLSWNNYAGFDGGVSGYTIYRVVNDAAPGSLVATTGPNATTYTDDIENAASQGAKVEYMVQATEGFGNPHGIFETSNSNLAAVYMEGNIFIPNAFAPSGHNKTWRPVTHFIDKTDYSVSVFNRWGKKVFETSHDDVSWDGSDCIPDVYVYLIRYKTSVGEYKEAKGTVLLLE